MAKYIVEVRVDTRKPMSKTAVANWVQNTLVLTRENREDNIKKVRVRKVDVD